MGLNLRAIVRGPINAVNNDILIAWAASTGPSAQTAAGKVAPTYAQSKNIFAQIQPLPTDALKHLFDLNITGVLRRVYMRDAVASSVRADGTGGDLLQFAEVPNGPQRTWLIVQVMEQWPTFCNVVAKLQNDQNNSYVWPNAPTY